MTTGREWMDGARCAGSTQPEIWYSRYEADKILARRICNTLCPVRQECLEYAVATGETNGIWGGLDSDERRRGKRKAQKAARIARGVLTANDA